jgi:alpha-tubulin suppressor-like RCC1 family protein
MFLLFDRAKGVAVPAQVTPRLVGDLDFCAILAGQEWKSQIKQQLHQQQSANQPTVKTDVDDSLAATKAPPSAAKTEPKMPGSSTASASTQLAQVPVITKLACGPAYSAAISSSGHVYVWGSK